MKNPLELRFIPKWLGAVVKHYDANLTNFESIVSKQDMKLYKVANFLFRTKLELMRIRDFQCTAADLEHQYSEEDAVFALYGQNPERKTVPQFTLTQFDIKDDGKGGLVILERSDGPSRDLTEELLKAIDAQRGRTEAYDSDSFKRYLSSVSNDHVNTVEENLVNLVKPPVVSPPGGGDPSGGSNSAKE